MDFSFKTLDTPSGRRILLPVSMNRLVQRTAADQARPSAGLSLCVRLDAPLSLERAALTPFLLADAAPAATTPTDASDLAV